jgi:cytochrome c553
MSVMNKRPSEAMAAQQQNLWQDDIASVAKCVSDGQVLCSLPLQRKLQSL